MYRSIAVLGLMLMVASTASAMTLAEKFKSNVQRKVAPEFGTIAEGKWKAFCVCNPTNDVGVLESYNGIPNLGVTCTVPTFTSSGDYSIGVACYDWTLLTK